MERRFSFSSRQYNTRKDGASKGLKTTLEGAKGQKASDTAADRQPATSSLGIHKTDSIGIHREDGGGDKIDKRGVGL